MKLNKVFILTSMVLIISILLIVGVFISYEQRGYYFYFVLLLPPILIVCLKEKIVSIPTIVMVYYFLFVGIGGGIIYAQGRCEYNVYEVCLIPYYLMAIGIFLGSFIKPKKYVKCRSRKYLDICSINRINILVLLYLISTLCGVFFVLKYADYILSNITSNRVSVMSGNGLLLLFVRLPILIIPTLINEIYNLKNYNVKNKLINGYTIIIMLCLSTVILFTTGYRTRALVLLLCSFLCYYQNKKLPIRKLLYAILVLAIITIVYGSFREGNELIHQVQSELTRNVINLNYIFNFFPKYVKYQHGYTYMINFLMLLPGPDLDFTLWLKEQLQLSFNGGGVTPTIMGEFYINFGYYSIFIGMLFFGFICKIVDNKILKKASFMYIFVCWELASACAGGVGNVLVDIFIFGVIAWFINLFPSVSLRKEYAVYDEIC